MMLAVDMALWFVLAVRAEGRFVSTCSVCTCVQCGVLGPVSCTVFHLDFFFGTGSAFVGKYVRHLLRVPAAKHSRACVSIAIPVFAQLSVDYVYQHSRIPDNVVYTHIRHIIPSSHDTHVFALCM